MYFVPWDFFPHVGIWKLRRNTSKQLYHSSTQKFLCVFHEFLFFILRFSLMSIITGHFNLYIILETIYIHIYIFSGYIYIQRIYIFIYSGYSDIQDKWLLQFQQHITFQKLERKFSNNSHYPKIYIGIVITFCRDYQRVSGSSNG